MESIELDPLEDPYQNQKQSLVAACEEVGLSDNFILMNDDFHVMRHIDTVPVLHGPTVRGHHEWFIERGKAYEAPYLDGIRQTLAEVESWGVLDPLTYERHSPLPMNKQALRALLAKSTSDPFLWQTAYAAITEDVGVYGPDAKNDTYDLTYEQLHDFVLDQSPFLSSWDGSFRNGPIGDLVRESFPHPCRYEAAPQI